MNNLITKNFKKSSLLLLLFVFQLIISLILGYSHTAHDDEFLSPAGEVLLQPVVDGPTEYRAMEAVAAAVAAAGGGGSRRKLAPFQLCLLCKCCAGAACASMPCCFGIDCQLPNKPFGVCAFVPKTCNCTSCAS